MVPFNIDSIKMYKIKQINIKISITAILMAIPLSIRVNQMDCPLFA